MSASKRKKKRRVEQVELIDHAGDDKKLAEALEAIASKVNEQAQGGWAAVEWLKLAVQPGLWVASKIKKGTVWAFEQLASYNEREAKAEKTRKEGEALLVAAEAESEVKRAKAQVHLAKAEAIREKTRGEAIKHETAEELLRQIRGRGIDLAADIIEGRLRVGVVKEAEEAGGDGPTTKIT
jgi:hypothetical protein